MNLKKEAKKNLKLYAILDRGAIKSPIKNALAKAFKKGCDFLQLRDKRARTGELLSLSKRMARLIKRRKKIFLINDRIDVARAVNANGAHLGKGDFSVKLSRRLLGKNAIIGKTAHNLKEAIQAAKEGATYISVGPIFKTPFKKGLAPLGIDFVKRVRKRVAVPIFCVGGINSSNIRKFENLKIEGVAMIRGVFS